jgi:ATP-dependent Clp protease ATP-binding subunit ClpA
MHPGIISWKNLVIFSYNFFSVPLLLKTLFSPFQNDKPSKNFDILEIVVFAIFSRFLGFAFRIVLIALGLVFTILMILTFPLFFFIPIKISRETLRDFGSIGSELSYGYTFYLNKHSHDLVSIDNIKLYGKEKSLRMIERALDKDTLRNVLLVGETGVGKSLVVSYLGRLGKSGLSFSGIAHHRVVNFVPEDISIEDFEHAMHEATSAGNIILAIENIDVYEGVFEKLLPYLDKRHLGVVATTDFGNYDRVLKAHPEFLSKFEKIDMEPASLDETISILNNHIAIKRMQVDKDALDEIVRLSDRYIGNQPEPLKSLLVLEELRSLNKRINIADVRQIVSDKTNMQIGDLGGDEKQVLVNLENTMREKIIGQDEAVEDVAQALKRLRTGIADPTKPAGSFMFLGPTGVGKTYTAKILAESYFGRKDSMIRFDMSEFSMPDSVSVFSDRLASVIEEMPLSLVFFDELEKAHRTIHQLLLQVLDEGRLTRENGREASFKNAIIIATTNAGSRSLLENPNIDKKVLIDNLIEANLFAPEFLNRFSSVILFKPLNQESVRKVSQLLLVEFQARLFEDKGITLELTDALVDKIASAGFDPDFGARPIHRAIEEIVENKVADFIISGDQSKIIKIL